MNKAQISIILFLSAQLVVLPSTNAQKSAASLCKTENDGFIISNDIKAKKLKKNADTVIHIYEGDSYYAPAYSFIFSRKHKSNKNQFIIDRGAKPKVRNSTNEFLNKMNVDSLFEIAKMISQKDVDTSISLSHDHLLYFHFYVSNKEFVFEFCENQMMMFPSQGRIKYLKDFMSHLRRENRQ